MKRIMTYLDLHLMDRRKCNIMADAFKLSVKKGYNTIDFITKVMTSKKLDWLFAMDDCFEWADDAVLLSVLEHNLKLKKGPVLDEFTAWLIGYTYKYWLLTWNTNRYEIWNVLPVQRFLASFDFYHTQDWDYVIEDAIKVYETGNYVV